MNKNNNRKTQNRPTQWAEPPAGAIKTSPAGTRVKHNADGTITLIEPKKPTKKK